MEQSLDNDGHDGSREEETERVLEHEAVLSIFSCFVHFEVNEKVYDVGEDEFVEEDDADEINEDDGC